MNKGALALAGLALLALLATQRRSISGMVTAVNDETLNHPNVRAFLRMIRVGEGTSDAQGYQRLYGYRAGAQFADMSGHPNVRITAGGITSTAAGAYQILYRTWVELVTLYGLPDFSPHSQDLAAVALIKRRNALDDVIAGRFADAVAKCSKEWASLPGSPYGQRTVTLAAALQNFQQYGGRVA